MIAKSPTVHVITVNWNRPEETLTCLDSLEKQHYTRIKIIVVDNGSDDHSPAMIAEQFPSVQMIRLKENKGFAVGFNTGIRHALKAGAELIFILNNDTDLARDTISILVENMSDDTGILAPMIYFAHKPDMIWNIGGKISRLTLDVHLKMANKKDPSNWSGPIEHDFVTGCAMMIPRKTLTEIGLFDENFKLFYEDADFCLRTHSAGRKIMVIPEAKMWHKVAVSSGGIYSPYYRYWYARSSIRYFSKHAELWQVPFIIFRRTASSIKTTFYLAMRFRWTAIKSYWLGIIDGLKDAI